MPKKRTVIAKEPDSCRYQEKYNDMIECPEGKGCRTCGWNPNVADRRVNGMLKRLSVENPAEYRRLTGVFPAHCSV